jgi:hypothetical protein
VGGEVFFEDFGKFDGGWRFDCGDHAKPTSSAAPADS